MKTAYVRLLSKVIVSLGAMLFLWASSAAHAVDLPVIYRVDQTKIKTLADGSSIFFQLFTNASCDGTPLLTQEVQIQNVKRLEDLRLVKRTGVSVPPKTVRLEHLLTGAEATPFLFLNVLGAFPRVGEECQQQFLPTLGATAPTGLIALWSGTLADIPAGWALCDGANGTPDLRERFIRGVLAGEDPGGSGGADTHSHATTGHSHSWSDTSSGPSGTVSGGSTGSAATETHTHDFSGTTTSTAPGTNAVSNLPPYFELAFIMKLQ